MNVLTGSKHCCNHHGTTITLSFSSIRGKLSSKKSPSVLSEILRLLVNTLTADDKYSRSIMQNFRQLFQTKLSKKQKTFWRLSVSFLKCAVNLEHFQKKDEHQSLIFTEINDFEKLWVHKRLKGFASEHFRYCSCYLVPNTSEISTAWLLSSFLVNSS